MAALRDPMTVGIATRVLAIPAKRADKRLVLYLTRAEIDAMLAAHDLTGWARRRDHALLLTLYNTGARVSEITGLQRTDVKFGINPAGQNAHRFKADNTLLKFLSAL